MFGCKTQTSWQTKGPKSSEGCYYRCGLEEAADIVLQCVGRWRGGLGIAGALLGVTGGVTPAGCRRLRAADGPRV